MEKKNIENFLNEEYKEFAMYSLESRAIASMIDGFKPVQRKIIHISSNIWKTGNEKTLRVFQLSGKVASDSFYHHGDKSLNDAIINMAQSFKNNAPLLDEDGQFGSLRSPESGAPRYIGTRLNSSFRKIYKDFNLLENQIEEGEMIEPKFLLPIIPMLLINGGGGIAVGFRSEILNRDVKTVARECLRFLKSNRVNKIPPHLNGFKGTYRQDDDNPNKWWVKGVFERVNTTTVKITELPPSITYQNYEDHLEKLIENDAIKSYEDNCRDDVNYVIKMSRKDLKEITDDKLVKLLKLEETQYEYLNVLDENGKLKTFTDVKDILKYFVKFRLKWYDIRKKTILENMEKDLKVMTNKAKFISLIIKGDILINNIKKTDIEKSIAKYKLDKVLGSYNYLFKIPIHNLTKENYEKIQNDMKASKKDISYLKKVKPKDMYIDELEDFIKKWK